MMLAATLLALMVQGPPPQRPAPKVLGVLETPQMEGGSPVMARLLFQRIQGRWRPMAPKAVRALPVESWAVAFRGRKLGSVDLAAATVLPGADLREGLLRALSDPTQAPRVTEGVEAFGGWMRRADRRPLVIQPGGIAPDPDGWAPQTAPADFRVKLWPALLKAWGRWRPVHCPKDPEHAEPLRVGPADLVVRDAFRARDGRWVVALGLEPARFPCDGPADPEGSPHWFLIEGGAIRFLGRELTWVEAGDFGGTGGSDLLFFHAGYNEDGYVLLTEGLRRPVEVRWSYH